MQRILALVLLLISLCAPAQAQSVGNTNNFVVGAVASGGPFAEDSFPGTSGTNLTSHTDTLGNSWSYTAVVGGGKFELDGSGNIFYLETSNNGTVDAIDSGTPPSANYSVSATILGNSTSATVPNVGVIARGSNSVKTGYFCIRSTSASDWKLLALVSGTSTTLGSSTTPTYSDGTSYTLKLTVNGSTISCTANGTTIASVSDSSITAAGFSGIFGSSATTPASCSANFCISSFVAQ